MSDAMSQRPTSDEDRAGWKAYWATQGMAWRTEPEIDEERQRYLAERRVVQADTKRAIYPFRDEHGSITLNRADVEWLLAAHESGGVRGPIRWQEERDKPEADRRHGLDLRGANLRGASLQGLPLARLIAGLQHMAAYVPSRRERFLSAVHLEGADLSDAHLEGALLGRARFQRADLSRAYLCAADLYAAHVEGANLTEARLGGAILRDTYFDRSSYLDNAEPSDAEHGGFCVVDTRWGGVKLATIRWNQVGMLGDERFARRLRSDLKRRKLPNRRVVYFERAVRAYRQVAIGLRTQGLNELADRFAYRAQRLERTVQMQQGHLGRALGSWLLDLISGYGYRPLRSFIAYVVIICLFAGTYLLNAQFAAPHLTWDESLVLSISSFHGRGFFTSGVSLGDTLARLAAGEAIIGLLIEITFIATFTQRFFSR